ncbi:hypothetical protein BCD67_15850 [Oscillatoriales cyanobacterium USR001]|nr:hypothetical protein BCD67_15850 [Oscillatoriales cyanobacterium USR001]
MQTIEKKSSLFNRMLIAIVSLLVIAAIAISFRLAFPEGKTIFAGQRPTNLGIQSGQLAPCPSSPNCVSSFSQTTEHKIEPLTYNSTPAEVMAKLKKVIQSLERTKIITETDNYLYAEFTSALMGFVDDVEFLLDEGKKVIQVRSASRLGDSDFGVNRQRIETIRINLNKI